MNKETALDCEEHATVRKLFIAKNAILWRQIVQFQLFDLPLIYSPFLLQNVYIP